MKRVDVLQQRTVISTDPADWDRQVNEAIRDVSGKARNAPTIRRQMNAGELIAVIEYFATNETPEDAIDREHLKGHFYTCDDCPYLEKVTDKRFKNLSCSYGMRAIACRCDDACLWFYEQMEKGTEK